ncbi:glycosyltransferase 87 family protein [Paractinoplanes hotanensis]|uniref:Glycosyltransferase 87 family protein n=1 Tax=Paractinoplanes hotanensis TaxID=2906497 RepID=A0ABT0Y5D1_9ACTN|nr:glycosyltransferase 87 family protein [Actinoplanes hotanensis]MCM4080733.1 glycosyltransferase 87 family protein [Actinoplanes hotanensis]
MTRLRVSIVVVAAIAVGVFLVTVPTFREFFDLGVYRGAVRSWLLDGNELYDFLYQDTQYGFTYPPFAALVLGPLALTSWPVAIASSVVVNAAAVALLLRWFLAPVVRRHGGPMWFVCSLAFLAILVFEPARDTFSFGQVNLALLVLVLADLRALTTGRRWAGIGIGLAAAIKLTPIVFIGYLIVTRQYRAAATATATAAAATLLAVLVAPATSAQFWLTALWDTDRVGRLEYVSNQSLRGVAARLELPSTWWLAAVALILAVWFLRVRLLRDTPDHAAGFAATGAVACLISPVTWVHHLVWLLPALFLLVDAALQSRSRPRLAVLAATYVILSSSVVWLWWAGADGFPAAIGSNTYVWISIGLLLTVPFRAAVPAPDSSDLLTESH